MFIHLEWSRFELWVLAVALGAVAFGALGVAIGAVARELNSASLLALLLSLPIAFVALVPGSAVSGGLKTVLDVVAFVFPFKPALEAMSNGFSGAPPAIVGPAFHLLVLALVFGVLGRLALRRFA
jgi:ABC-2 type transport system permease protein